MSINPSNLQKQSYKIKSSHGGWVTFDCTWKVSKRKIPVMIFCHGFKGFKDWGAWNLLADFMAEEGFLFLKMNFSHNGVDPEFLSDITRPDLFAENTISKELEDLEAVLQWVKSDENPQKELINYEINLIGHSRGAATALIKTIHSSDVKRLAMWAPVADFSKFVEDSDGSWKETGVKHFTNSRTGESLPLNYAFVEDYLQNESFLDPKRNISKMDKPLFLAHGTEDENLPIEHTRTMYRFVSHSIMIEIEGAGHTFGATHPYTETILPENLTLLAEETAEFFNM